MKVHMVTLTIIDLDDIGADEIHDVIENVHYPNHCISPDVVGIKTADVGEWHDDHPLNFRGANAEWDKVFPALKELRDR